MSRAERVAVVLTLATIVVIAAPIYRDYGVAGGLIWTAVTGGTRALIIWVAGRATRDRP